MGSELVFFFQTLKGKWIHSKTMKYILNHANNVFVLGFILFIVWVFFVFFLKNTAKSID